MATEERVKRIEKAMVLMQELVVRHEERIDTFDADFKRSREDFEFKLNALIDAQLKNEEGIRELREASSAQLHRIERLETR